MFVNVCSIVINLFFVIYILLYFVCRLLFLCGFHKFQIYLSGILSNDAKMKYLYYFPVLHEACMASIIYIFPVLHEACMASIIYIHLYTLVHQNNGNIPVKHSLLTGFNALIIKK